MMQDCFFRVLFFFFFFPVLVHFLTATTHLVARLALCLGQVFVVAIDKVLSAAEVLLDKALADDVALVGVSCWTSLHYLGAVAVIAIFYTSDISMVALGVASGFLVLSVIANVLGIRTPIVYV